MDNDKFNIVYERFNIVWETDEKGKAVAVKDPDGRFTFAICIDPYAIKNKNNG